MEEEYKTILNIYKEEKIKIIDELKNIKGSLNDKKNLLENIEFIDDMIEKYSNKLSNNIERIQKSISKFKNNKNSNSKSKYKNKELNKKKIEKINEEEPEEYKELDSSFEMKNKNYQI